MVLIPKITESYTLFIKLSAVTSARISVVVVYYCAHDPFASDGLSIHELIKVEFHLACINTVPYTYIDVMHRVK